MLDIHGLRVFLEAARTENFTEAAQVLNITQPAVSMQIRSLEEYLQVSLFERSGRHIQLTRAGQALIPLAQQVIQVAINAEEAVRASQGKVIGDLVIGCSTASGKYILPHLLARFKRTYPDVRISIMVVNRRDAMDGVCSGSYDLADTDLRLSEYDVEYLDFFTDHLSLIVPVSHPWSRRDSIRPDELFTEQFICREPEAACRKIVGEALARLGLDMNNLQIVMEIGSAEAQAMAVEHGMGVAFVSLAPAMPRVALGRLATVRVEGMELLSPIEFVRCPGRPSSAVRTRFLEFVNNPQTRSQIEMLTKGLVV